MAVAREGEGREQGAGRCLSGRHPPGRSQKCGAALSAFAGSRAGEARGASGSDVAFDHVV